MLVILSMLLIYFLFGGSSIWSICIFSPSVEYDFRQQEGRFHHVLRALEIEDEGTQHQDLTRGSADDQTSQKQELKNKARKPKKTCFWCLWATAVKITATKIVLSLSHVTRGKSRAIVGHLLHFKGAAASCISQGK